MAANVDVWDAQSCGDPGGRHCKAGVVVGYTVARDQLLGLRPITFILVKYISSTLLGVSANVGERSSNKRDRTMHRDLITELIAGGAIAGVELLHLVPRTASAIEHIGRSGVIAITIGIGCTDDSGSAVKRD